MRSGALTPSRPETVGQHDPGRFAQPEPGVGQRAGGPRHPGAARGSGRRTGGTCRPGPPGSERSGAERAVRLRWRRPAGTRPGRRAASVSAAGVEQTEIRRHRTGSRPEVGRAALQRGQPGVRVLDVEHRVVAGPASSTGRRRCRSSGQRSSGPGSTGWRRRRGSRRSPAGTAPCPARLLIFIGSPSRTRLTNWPIRISRLRSGIVAIGTDQRLVPTDVAVVIRAEHDHDPVEAPLALVQVIGAVGGEVGPVAVALDQWPVLVVAEGGRAQPGRARPPRRRGPARSGA